MNLIKRKDGESRRGKYRAVFDITDATWKRHLDAPRSFGRLFIGELSGEESGGGGGDGGSVKTQRWTQLTNRFDELGVAAQIKVEGRGKLWKDLRAAAGRFTYRQGYFYFNLSIERHDNLNIIVCCWSTGLVATITRAINYSVIVVYIYN